MPFSALSLRKLHHENTSGKQIGNDRHYSLKIHPGEKTQRFLWKLFRVLLSRVDYGEEGAWIPVAALRIWLAFFHCVCE